MNISHDNVRRRHMKEISIFDVLGPNMIGPSSSHTAGAVRIALIARKIVGDDIASVNFSLYGSFAKTCKGHGTDRALVAGILGFYPDDERIKNSFAYAQKEGISFTFGEKQNIGFHPNTVVITIMGKQGQISIVRGSSIGGGEIIINNINGVDIDLTGEYYTILVRQKDEPGVVSHITKCLAAYDVNIAFMKLYREDKGAVAYTIVEADNPICKSVLKMIEDDSAIDQAVYISKME